MNAGLLKFDEKYAIIVYQLTSPVGALTPVRALATSPREWSTGAMTIDNLTLFPSPVPSQHSPERKYRYYETICWTCQCPLLRVVRKRQSTRHYCSRTCTQKAHEWYRLARLWASVRLEGECWIWQGYITIYGYGNCRGTSGNMLAHRYIYLLTHDAIPDGYELDHLCRRTACVNPAHLEAVTHTVNMKRSPLVTRTHCVHGHAYTPENTYLRRDGSKVCRHCTLAQQQAARKHKQHAVIDTLAERPADGGCARHAAQEKETR